MGEGEDLRKSQRGPRLQQRRQGTQRKTRPRSSRLLKRRLPEIASVEPEAPWTPSPLWICVLSILLASVGWYLSRCARVAVPQPARKLEIVVEPKIGKPPLRRTDSVDLCD